jgi:hypothetical protein
MDARLTRTAGSPVLPVEALRLDTALLVDPCNTMTAPDTGGPHGFSSGLLISPSGIESLDLK